MNVSVNTLLEFKGSQIYSVPSSTTVLEAVQEMVFRNIGAMLVMDGGRLRGIFTARESLPRVIAEQRNPERTLVHEVMRTDYPHLTRDMSADEAVTLFETQRITHIPVFEGALVVGVLSLHDLARWYSTASRAEAESLHYYITTSLGS